MKIYLAGKIWRLGAVALIAVFSTALASPALAWDADRRTIPCGATHTIPAPFGASFIYDQAAHTSATIFVFTDAAKSPTDGHSLRHFISTSGKSLTVEVKTTSVVVKAAECPVAKEFVPCKTDPLVAYDKGQGQSYSTRYTSADHSEGLVIIYLDEGRVEAPGRAVIHPFWTKDITVNGRHYGCELKFKGVKVNGQSSVSVAAIAKASKK